ncbi:uncharacterized protein BP5553_01700 [Venustampulla echinocandica]|uniref:Uncharacterized protein n=1 Tax=Venustampulla echinocandica TaxID=2656787 RepID=A0A370U1T4_9HELO|nr:uncharacterized protein BP5553_01700 [Venustampulla echinocandica]RDL41721.1 hypothetical protein BP5553_01700 [Venustampulla echinocandica]
MDMYRASINLIGVTSTLLNDASDASTLFSRVSSHITDPDLAREISKWKKRSDIIAKNPAIANARQIFMGDPHDSRQLLVETRGFNDFVRKVGPLSVVASTQDDIERSLKYQEVIRHEIRDAEEAETDRVLRKQQPWQRQPAIPRHVNHRSGYSSEIRREISPPPFPVIGYDQSRPPSGSSPVNWPRGEDQDSPCAKRPRYNNPRFD